MGRRAGELLLPRLCERMRCAWGGVDQSSIHVLDELSNADAVTDDDQHTELDPNPFPAHYSGASGVLPVHLVGLSGLLE